MERKKIFSFAFAAVTALCSSTTFIASSPATFLKYKQELSNKLSTIEGEICSTFGISRIRWRLYKQSWRWSIRYRMNRLRMRYQSWGRALSPRFKAIVSQLFKRLRVRFKVFNAKEYIDPNETDPAKKDPDLYYGESGASRIYIDEETMEQDNLSDAAIEGTILHEASHIVAQYELAWFSLERLIASRSNSVDASKAQQLLKRFAHLHEEIADTLAGLAGGLSTVSALASVYQASFCGDSDTHPSSSTRVSYLQRLQREMQADPYYSGGGCYGGALRVSL